MKNTGIVSHEIGARVLIIAYACEPGRGSEPGTGWNMALGLAEFHQITVVTRANNQPVIEKFLETYSGSRPEFLYLDPAPWILCLKKRRIVPVQLFYYFWQQEVASIIDTQKLKFDILHQLTFNSFEVPPFSFGQTDAINIWGPVGGGQTTPNGLLRAYPPLSRLKEKLRSIRVKLSARSSRVKKALLNSSLILFANNETRLLLNGGNCTETGMMIDVGVDIKKFQPPEKRSQNDKITVLSVGGLEPRKGVTILLEAFSLLNKEHPNVELRIVGKGPLDGQLRECASNLGLKDRVIFTGSVDHEMMNREFADADIFVFPSLRDTSGAVVLEAMAMELPVVCFDHQGAALMVDDDCGIRVPTGNFNESVQELRGAIELLINDKQLRISLGKSGRRSVAKVHDWEVKVARISELYERLAQESKPATCGGTGIVSP